MYFEYVHQKLALINDIKILFGDLAIRDLMLGEVQPSIRLMVARHGPQKPAKLAVRLKEFDNHWAPNESWSASLACVVTTIAVLATNVLTKQCTHCKRQGHIQKYCRKRMREGFLCQHMGHTYSVQLFQTGVPISHQVC